VKLCAGNQDCDTDHIFLVTKSGGDHFWLMDSFLHCGVFNRKGDSVVLSLSPPLTNGLCWAHSLGLKPSKARRDSACGSYIMNTTEP